MRVISLPGNRISAGLDQRFGLDEISANAAGTSIKNLTVLKTGKARAVRFSTLPAIGRELECQTGDNLEYVRGETDDARTRSRQPLEVVAHVRLGGALLLEKTQSTGPALKSLQ